ncbi:MAG TPA: sugar ABC transporter ATP-binding protein [Polyangiaceae bacterium]|jgi:D-xylose transport system ATP-binding protein
MSERAPILRARDIVKRFGGVTALGGVSFELFAGEVHALCGENGAGKSTLIKLLSGIHPHGSYEGSIAVRGEPVAFSSSRDAEAAGIAVIHQELALVPDMTVAENLCLGAAPRRLGLIDWDGVYARAKQVLAAARIELDPTRLVRELGVAEQQLLEIAKAVGKEPAVLILDEPTAALSDREVERLLELVTELSARGMACVYISHKLEEVFRLAHRITVLRDGKSVYSSERSATTPGEIVRHMVGRPIEDLFPKRASRTGAPLLSVRDLTVSAPSAGRMRLNQLSFEVRGGEVLGIGGLMGAGRSELLLHLIGAWGKREAGSVLVDGAPLPEGAPDAALHAGIALVSEDRKRYGLFLDSTIGFNLTLSSLYKQKRPVIDPAEDAARAKSVFSSLAVKAPNLDSKVSSLSGGNQQKVVLGRVLLAEPKVLLLDEPTRGIDVGAKLDVYEIVNRLAGEGKAIVLVSSELPELLGMSDRIVMLCEGRITGEFSRGEANQEKLLSAAMGAMHA